MNKTKEKKPKSQSLDTLRNIFGNRPSPDEIAMPETKMVDIRDLRVDPRYQRNLSTGHVLKMLADFEASGVGLIYVGRRKDNTHWVVDGQQRLQLVRHLNAIFPDKFKKIPCEIFESRGEEHEATLYRVRNHKKKMTSLDIFKAKYAYGEADAMTILRIVNKRGLKIKGIPMVVPPDTGNHVQVSCVGALENGYKMGKKVGRAGIVLENAVDSIKECWGLDAHAFKNFMIEGFSHFFSRHPQADMNVVRSSMEGKKPNGIKSKIDTTSGYSRAKNVSDYILREFNKKARGDNRLGSEE